MKLPEAGDVPSLPGQVNVMRLIEYDETVSRPLPFYLAMEEYFARNFTSDSFFFMWQVEPTVIIGRHQLLEAEIDTAFCRSHGIKMVRRKSGGGAVYADRNNIMFSHITAAGVVADTFRDYTRRVASMLEGLGLDASASERNDVLVGDRKISGNAFYHLADRSIVHGTMLYDADPVMMAGALTPSAAKLQSKGISSVKSRITTLREHRPDLSLADFKSYVARNMSDGDSYRLTPADIEAINRIAETYFEPSWLTGKNPAGTIVKSRRFPGAGELTATIDTARGKISAFTLTGDFFAAEAMTPVLSEALAGVDYTPEAVAKALADVDVARLISGITTEQFIDLIF